MMILVIPCFLSLSSISTIGNVLVKKFSNSDSLIGDLVPNSGIKA